MVRDVGSFDSLPFDDLLLTLFYCLSLGRNHLRVQSGPYRSGVSPSRVLQPDIGHGAEAHQWHDHTSALLNNQTS